MGRSDSMEKNVMLGKVEGTRRRGRPTSRWIDSIASTMEAPLALLKKGIEDRAFWKQSIYMVARNRLRLDGT